MVGVECSKAGEGPANAVTSQHTPRAEKREDGRGTQDQTVRSSKADRRERRWGGLAEACMHKANAGRAKGVLCLRCLRREKTKKGGGSLRESNPGLFDPNEESYH